MLDKKQMIIETIIGFCLLFIYYGVLYRHILEGADTFIPSSLSVAQTCGYWGYPFSVALVFSFLFRKINRYWVVFLLSVLAALLNLWFSYLVSITISIYWAGYTVGYTGLLLTGAFVYYLQSLYQKRGISSVLRIYLYILLSLPFFIMLWSLLCFHLA